MVASSLLHHLDARLSSPCPKSGLSSLWCSVKSSTCLPRAPSGEVKSLASEMGSEKSLSLTGEALSCPFLGIQWEMPGKPNGKGALLGLERKAAPYTPQLQDVGDIPRWEDSSDVVEISHIEAPIRATCQGHRGQELVAVSKAIAAGTGNAPPASIAHDTPDDGGLLRHELVLPIPFVQDACNKHRTEPSVEQGKALLCG